MRLTCLHIVLLRLNVIEKSEPILRERALFGRPEYTSSGWFLSDRYQTPPKREVMRFAQNSHLCDSLRVKWQTSLRSGFKFRAAQPAAEMPVWSLDLDCEV